MFLTILLIFVAFVGFIWLVVHAFKKDVLWGFGVLALAPITPTIYAIKNWNEAKTPFLVYIIPFVLLVFTAPEIFITDDGLERLFTKEGIEQSAAKTRPPSARNTFPEEVVDVAEQAAAILENRETRSEPIWVPAPDAKDPRYKAISLDEAKDYIGATMILIDRNDVSRKGTLVGVAGNTLRFERRLSGGRVSYKVRADDIKALKVSRY